MQVQRALDRIDRLTPAELKPKRTKKIIKKSLHARKEDRHERVYANRRRDVGPASVHVPGTPAGDRLRKKSSKPTVANREHDRRARIRARIFGDEQRGPPRDHRVVRERESVVHVRQPREQAPHVEEETRAGPQSAQHEPLGCASADDHFQISSDTRNQTSLDDLMVLADTDRAWTVRGGFACAHVSAITDRDLCTRNAGLRISIESPLTTTSLPRWLVRRRT